MESKTIDYSKLSDEELRKIIDGTSDLVDSIPQEEPKPTQRSTTTVPQTKGDIGFDDVLNFLGGAGQTMLQVPTLGFGDELSGVVSAPFIYGKGKFQGDDVSLLDAYQQGRDASRQSVNQFMSQNPMLSLGLQTVSTIPAMTTKALNYGQSLLSPAVKKYAQRNPIKASTGLGAGTGAVTGLGQSEGENIYELGKDFGVGGLFGGVLSPAMFAIGKTGQILGKPITNRMRPPREIAEEEFVRTLRQSGKTMSDADMKFDDSIVGLSLGENVRKKLDTMASMPGQTADRVDELLKQYRGGLNPRLLEPLRQETASSMVNPNRLTYTDFIADKMAQRKRIADPLYAKLRTFNFEVDKNPELENVLTRSQKYFKDAADLAQLDGRTFTLSPDVAAFDQVNAGELDTLKRTLDDAISKAYNSEKTKTKGRSLQQLKNDLVDAVDKLTMEGDESAYKTARDAYAKESSFITQAEQGREFFKSNKIDSTDTQLYFDSLTNPEKEAFRLGAFESIKRRAGDRAGKTYLMNARSAEAGGQEEVADKLKVLFRSDDAWKKFVERAEFEYKSNELSRLGKMSPTAPRESFIDDMADQGAELSQGLAGMTYSAKTGDPTTALMSLANLKNLTARTFTPTSVRDELGKLLTAKKSDFPSLGLDNIEQRVLDRQEQDTINRILRAQRFNLLNNPYSQSIGFGLFD